MVRDPEFFVLKPFAWMNTDEYEECILGAVVEDYASPTDAYAPIEGNDAPASVNPYSEDHENKQAEEHANNKKKHKLHVQTFDDFILGSRATTEAGAEIKLKSLANLSFKGNTESAIDLNGKLITCKRLQHIDLFWETLKKHPEMSRVRKWRFSKDKPVCLVVGILLCEDVEIDFSGERSRHIEGQTEIPLCTIAAAISGVLAPSDGTGNPSIAASKAKRSVNVFRAKAGGSKIFAVALRTVNKVPLAGFRLGEGPAIAEGRKAGLDEEEDNSSDDEDLVLGVDGPFDLKNSEH